MMLRKSVRPTGSLALSAALLLSLSACAGSRGAGRPDEPLITEEGGLHEPPARNTEPPPTHLPGPPLAATPPPPPAADEPAPADEPAAPEPAKGAVPYAGPRGTIRRADLLAVLDRKPASFLRAVDSEPRFEHGRFRGWSINAIFPGDPRFTGIDIQKGDVVVRVNGKPVEQPEQFIQVWEDMRQARELRVDLLRNGRPHIARWSIVD